MELSPSIGVGEGVGAGDGDSANWSRVPRFLPSLDLAMTIWALRASCSKDFILKEQKERIVRLEKKQNVHTHWWVSLEWGEKILNLDLGL